MLERTLLSMCLSLVSGIIIRRMVTITFNGNGSYFVTFCMLVGTLS